MRLGRCRGPRLSEELEGEWRGDRPLRRVDLPLVLATTEKLEPLHGAPMTLPSILFVPGQTWNELPQPQLLTTFGLLNTNPRFSRPS